MVFTGDQYIPEAEGYLPQNDGLVYPGRMYDYNGEELYRKWLLEYGFSRHMTIVFNSFVYLTVFNMINSRKINDEMNPFEGLLGNRMFISIWFIICIAQVSNIDNPVVLIVLVHC